MNNIFVTDLKKLKNINIIDIRECYKYNDNHIMGAKNIPFNQLIISPDKYLNKDNKYYIYCQKGIKSKKLCQFLFSKGYNVVNIIGGYEAWILNN